MLKKLLMGFACLSAAVALPLAAQTTRHTSVATPGPLAGVRYDHRYEVYVGADYTHFSAGHNLKQGANLGGFDVQGTRWFNSRWGAQAAVRGAYGTSGTAPNAYGIRGPFVDQYTFMAGPQYLGPHNVHGAFTLHALFGGAHGSFESDLYDQSGNKVQPSAVGFYSNQTTFSSALGGTIDLNRSPQFALRFTPDLLLTHYGGEMQEHFGISVGILYRLKKKR